LFNSNTFLKGTNMFIKKIVTVAALTVASSSAFAEVGDISIGVGAGITQGTGFEIGYDVGEAVAIRFVNYSGELSQTESLDDIAYDISLKTETPGLMVDFYPTEGRSFRLTLGAVDNGNRLSAVATAAANYEIGGLSYTAAEVGSLKTEIAFSGFTPYVGLGYRMHTTKQLFIDFDLGMLIGSAPEVIITADGSLSSNTAFKADLDKERKSLEDDLSSFKYLPMAKIALTYKF
jgi:hypothetical protein